jgi:hypothetical protein
VVEKKEMKISGELIPILLVAVFTTACGVTSREKGSALEPLLAPDTAMDNLMGIFRETQDKNQPKTAEELKSLSLDGKGLIFYHPSIRSGAVRNEVKTDSMIWHEHASDPADRRYYPPRYIVDLRSGFMCWLVQKDEACRKIEEVTDSTLKAQLDLIRAADQRSQTMRPDSTGPR